MGDVFDVVHIVPGTPQREWCDLCLTSGALVFPLYVLTGDGPRWLGEHYVCTTCTPLTTPLT